MNFIRGRNKGIAKVFALNNLCKCNFFVIPYPLWIRGNDESIASSVRIERGPVYRSCGTIFAGINEREKTCGKQEREKERAFLFTFFSLRTMRTEVVP